MNEDKKAAYRKEAADKGGRRGNFFYVDTTKLERLGISQYKSKQSGNFIRIVSPDINEFFAREIFSHPNIGVDRSTFLCLKKMFDEPCPICEKVQEMSEKDPEDERIKGLRWSRRYLMFLYDVTSSDTEKKGLHWYDAPVTVKQGIAACAEQKMTGKIIEVEHPAEGRDIEFTREGTTRENTTYSGYKLYDNNPIPEEWTKNIPTFDDVLLIPKYDDIVLELSGGLMVEEKDSTKEEVPSTRSRRAPESVVEEVEESKERPVRASRESGEPSSDKKMDDVKARIRNKIEQKKKEMGDQKRERG